MQDEQLPVVFNNYDKDDFNAYEFESLMYGVLRQNPGSDVFYDVKPGSEAAKAEVEAYMAQALEDGTIQGSLGAYDDPAILHTAKVMAEPEIKVGAFNAGPVVEESEVDEFLEGVEGQEIPEDLGGPTKHHRSDDRDEGFTDYVLDTSVSLEDALVVHSVPTSITLKFEREDVPVHRVNDQLVSQQELQELSAYHDPEG